MKKIGLRDVLIGGGALGLSVGAGWIYPPAGLITGGVVALYLGLFGVPAWR